MPKSAGSPKTDARLLTAQWLAIPGCLIARLPPNAADKTLPIVFFKFHRQLADHRL